MLSLMFLSLDEKRRFLLALARLDRWAKKGRLGITLEGTAALVVMEAKVVMAGKAAMVDQVGTVDLVRQERLNFVHLLFWRKDRSLLQQMATMM